MVWSIFSYMIDLETIIKYMDASMEIELLMKLRNSWQQKIVRTSKKKYIYI